MEKSKNTRIKNKSKRIILRAETKNLKNIAEYLVGNFNKNNIKLEFLKTE